MACPTLAPRGRARRASHPDQRCLLQAAGRHTLKFGGDVNNIHEVMINLFQGGGIYSYGDTNNTANFQDWILDAFQGSLATPIPTPDYHYNSFVQTVDVVNTKAGTQGKDDFWMNMYDGFAEDSWKIEPQADRDGRRALRCATDSGPRHSSTTITPRFPRNTPRPSRTCWIVFSRASASHGAR